MTTRYMMFSDDALAKFRGFCAAAGFANPQGAFDSKPKFARDQILARLDDLPEGSGDAGSNEKLLAFLRGKLSDGDFERATAMLSGEDVAEDEDRRGEGQQHAAQVRQQPEDRPGSNSKGEQPRAAATWRTGARCRFLWALPLNPSHRHGPLPSRASGRQSGQRRCRVDARRFPHALSGHQAHRARLMAQANPVRAGQGRRQHAALARASGAGRSNRAARRRA